MNRNGASFLLVRPQLYQAHYECLYLKQGVHDTIRFSAFVVINCRPIWCISRGYLNIIKMKPSLHAPDVVFLDRALVYPFSSISICLFRNTDIVVTYCFISIPCNTLQKSECLNMNCQDIVVQA